MASSHIAEFSLPRELLRVVGRVDAKGVGVGGNFQ